MLYEVITSQGQRGIYKLDTINEVREKIGKTLSFSSHITSYNVCYTKLLRMAYFADYPGSRIVDWADVLALIDAGDEPFILSIRQQDVYDAGHVEGAYLAAWGTDLAEKVAMLPTDETVYVYCYTGQTAGQTVALLNLLGIDAVSIKSGFNNGFMKVEGYEEYLSTEAAELPDAGASFDTEVLAFVQDYFSAIPDSGSNILAAADVEALVESGDATVVDIRSAEDFV